MSTGEDVFERSLKRIFKKDEKADHHNFLVDYGDGVTYKKQIKKTKYTSFWTSYCKYIYEGGSKIKIYQIEVEAMPLIVLFKKKLKNDELIHVVCELQTYLLNHFSIDEHSDNDIDCVVLETKSSTMLHFPMCRMLKRDIIITHFPKIATLFDYEIDQNAYQSLPLYGSDDFKYKLVYSRIVFPDDEYAMDTASLLELSMESVNNLAVFEIAQHTKVEQGLIRDDIFTEERQIEENEDHNYYWLPLLLSVDYWRTTTKTKNLSREYFQNFLFGMEHTYDVDKMKRPSYVNDNINDHEHYTKFIDMCDPNTILSSVYWKVIGEAYHTLTEGSEIGLRNWIAVIKRKLPHARTDTFLTNLGKSLECACEEAYNSFTSGKRDAITLMQLAERDNPEILAMWKVNWVMEAAKASLTGHEGNVAHVLKRLLITDCYHIQRENSGTWYRKQGHKTIPDHNGSWMKLRMGDELARLYLHMHATLSAQHQKTGGTNPDVLLLLKKILNINEKLNTISFQRNLLAISSPLFDVGDYIDLESDLTLLHNGVIVASEKQVFIRDGLLQDYLYKSFNARYCYEYTWDHPLVSKLMWWMYITFVKIPTIEYFRKFLASLLRGGNNDKKVYWWVGKTGNNMKTTWQKIVMRMCGQRAVSMPVNHFTKGKGMANSASPAEYKLVGASIMFSEEPEESVQFLSSVLKKEGSSDPREVRKNFGDSFDFIPTHKTVIVANVPNGVAKKEGALVERMVFIPFISQASYDYPPTLKEQIDKRIFKRDPFFDRTLLMLTNALLWVSFQSYSLYATEGMRVPPPDVERYVNEYWKSIDKYSTFIDQYVENDEDGVIEPTELYQQFYKWHTVLHRKEDVPASNVVFEGVEQYLGKTEDGVWRGKNLKRPGDDNQRKREGKRKARIRNIDDD